MDKSQLRAALVRQLQADLALQAHAARTSHDEATHEESKPENQYDMHAQEAAYLAEGQARLVAELEISVAQFAGLELRVFTPDDPIAVGAIVSLQPPKGPELKYFLGPRAGGLEVIFEGQPLLVVTSASPLGRQLVGRRQGDVVQIRGRTGLVNHRISRVA